jgi:hypothetical protein
VIGTRSLVAVQMGPISAGFTVPSLPHRFTIIQRSTQAALRRLPSKRLTAWNTVALWSVEHLNGRLFGGGERNRSIRAGAEPINLLWSRRRWIYWLLNGRIPNGATSVWCTLIDASLGRRAATSSHEVAIHIALIRDPLGKREAA